MDPNDVADLVERLQAQIGIWIETAEQIKAENCVSDAIWFSTRSRVQYEHYLAVAAELRELLSQFDYVDCPICEGTGVQLIHTHHYDADTESFIHSTDEIPCVWCHGIALMRRDKAFEVEMERDNARAENPC